MIFKGLLLEITSIIVSADINWIRVEIVTEFLSLSQTGQELVHLNHRKDGDRRHTGPFQLRFNHLVTH